MRKRMLAQRGFTLIELLVVLVILALLAGLILPKFLGRSEDAKRGAATTQISSFKTALNLYALDAGQPPTTQQSLQALVVEPTSSPRPRKWSKGYLADSDTIPVDPWGNAYGYKCDDGENFVITSYGADGRPGGTEKDADIISNQLSGSR